MPIPKSVDSGSRKYQNRTLGAATGAVVEPTHRNGLLLLGDVLEVLDSTLKLPAVDGLGSLTGVLEGHPEVRAPRAGGLGRLDVRSVPNLHFGKKKEENGR